MLPESLRCRPGTYDAAVAHEIFDRGAYAIHAMPHGPMVRRYYERALADGRTPLIVDCGAYIGASALYFAQSWPAARVVAIEPDSGNLECLTANVAKEPHVEVVRGAIGAIAGTGYVHDYGCHETGYRVSTKPSGQSVDVYELGRFALAPYDARMILKVDIEGGEAELFAAAAAEISLYPVVIVEPHDYLIRCHSLSKSMLAWAAANDVDMCIRGENIVFFNWRLLNG